MLLVGKADWRRCVSGPAERSTQLDTVLRDGEFGVETLFWDDTLGEENEKNLSCKMIFAMTLHRHWYLSESRPKKRPCSLEWTKTWFVAYIFLSNSNTSFQCRVSRERGALWLQWREKLHDQGVSFDRLYNHAHNRGGCFAKIEVGSLKSFLPTGRVKE